MKQNTDQHREYTPLMQFTYLLFFALLGVLILGAVALAIMFFYYGDDTLISSLKNGEQPIGGLKILLVFQSLGLFLLPAFALSIFEKYKLRDFYGMVSPKINLLFVVILLTSFWMPIISLSYALNQQMVLPDFLKGIENWMRNSENAAAQTTRMILKMNSYQDLVVNLIVVAIVPAIAEEFMFRGAIQRIFTRAFQKPHLAICLAAILFSAIHMQFYGFVPRMLLGLALGYLYYFSGSIWYAIFAHFLNNAYAVVTAFYLQMQGKPFDNSDDVLLPWYGYLLSSLLVIYLFWYFARQSRHRILLTKQ